MSNLKLVLVKSIGRSTKNSQVGVDKKCLIGSYRWVEMLRSENKVVNAEELVRLWLSNVNAVVDQLLPADLLAQLNAIPLPFGDGAPGVAAGSDAFGTLAVQEPVWWTRFCST